MTAPSTKSGRVAHLYCRTKGCSLNYISGSFERGHAYSCPACKRRLSFTKGAKR